MSKRTVSKASYGYYLQARKNFYDGLETGDANLTENANGQLDRGLNMVWLGCHVMDQCKAQPHRQIKQLSRETKMTLFHHGGIGAAIYV